jgi:1-acyl-sn-glycerol-3-phosphate acyltransferase
VFYWVVKVILSPFLRTFWRPWIEGLENVPADGPAILASNHLSFLDSIFLPLMVPRRVTFLAKMDYFTGRGVKGRAKKIFFSGVGQLPIDRSGGKASGAALHAGVRVLSQGKLLGIYPEGTRSPDGRLYRGKVGVARMALEAKVLVIPVAMFGTFEVQPQGATMPRIRRVGMRIGRPMDFSRYEEMADDRFVLRSITDEIMYELMQLSGQEYVDVYAQKAKDDLAAARAAAAAVVAEAAATLPSSGKPSSVAKPKGTAKPAGGAHDGRRSRLTRAARRVQVPRPAAAAGDAGGSEDGVAAPANTRTAERPPASVPPPQRPLAQRPLAPGVPAERPPDPLQR